MSQLINDLNRLERLGSQHSKTSQKFIASALAVADAIAQRIPDDAGRLPRRFEVCSTKEGKRFLVCVNPVIGPLGYNNFYYTAEKISVFTAMHLANELANGLLNEMVQYMTSRNSSMRQGQRALEQAAAQLAAK